ncbi:type I restriction-modification system subunit M [Streptomyces millisiae]|uniref:site-specific DNA-methyltransferase (adenine-specific) n=1 Tax=Streptomyces millisiae TaxID=3075542 RepID=A0ABU2LLN5_9ACTN|nr:class I SAM-dependent DNA methyltransferase [Streptomyces sp. DSM 44918]MDT0318425.1 class I SAM-dependent DNA methyltransferase [Streptomyces sp. DSM 44918]
MSESKSENLLAEALPGTDSGPDQLDQRELENYLWGAAVRLRGLIDAGDYKQFIFPLLFYKRMCDVHDEEREQALAVYGGDIELAGKEENYQFQIPDEHHWETVRGERSGLGAKISKAMRAIEKANPQQLTGVFGDAQWTNTERLSDETLRDLLEHFSTQVLSLARVPEDELGRGYEYLIKKFADDSGHTAQEFYTNRTLVQLMTRMLEPEPGESVYDPTCGTGGMLVTAAAELKRQGKDYRRLRLFGQEFNVMTSSIARMNLYLHGIENFRIERGDTLSQPLFFEGDQLSRFDVVLANPPYSIKQWDRDRFAEDPRNMWGVPPQGRADYAFFQHIAASLDPKTGRCAILFPHGVLFRDDERAMREKLIESDLLECVLGLGPGLFYNSPMEACVVVLRRRKRPGREGKVLFIDAADLIERVRGQSFLNEQHIANILRVYKSFDEVEGFSAVKENSELLNLGSTLAISYQVARTSVVLREGPQVLKLDFQQWDSGVARRRNVLERAVSRINGLGV